MGIIIPTHQSSGIWPITYSTWKCLQCTQICQHWKCNAEGVPGFLFLLAHVCLRGGWRRPGKDVYIYIPMAACGTLIYICVEDVGRYTVWCDRRPPSCTYKFTNFNSLDIIAWNKDVLLKTCTHQTDTIQFYSLLLKQRIVAVFAWYSRFLVKSSLFSNTPVQCLLSHSECHKPLKHRYYCAVMYMYLLCQYYRDQL